MAARSLNKVMLIGNLTRDPELRYTPSGTAVVTFGLATNREWNDASGQRQEEVEFHNIVAWNKLAEICSQLLYKGRKISGKNYHQRSKIETVFSVIKRRYSSVLRAKSFATQSTEIISKLIVYNLDRKLNYLSLLVRGLHQSPKRQNIYGIQSFSPFFAKNPRWETKAEFINSHAVFFGNNKMTELVN